MSEQDREGDYGRADAEVTALLRRMSAGDKGAEQVIWTSLYDDIRQRARRAMRHQPPDHSLQTTALISAAYERIRRLAGKEWADRDHFLATIARAMHCALVDHARQPRIRREVRPELDALVRDVETRVSNLIEFDEAVRKLEAFDPAMARTAELKAIGMSMSEIVAALRIPRRSLDRRWSHARAFLYRCMT